MKQLLSASLILSSILLHSGPIGAQSVLDGLEQMKYKLLLADEGNAAVHYIDLNNPNTQSRLRAWRAPGFSMLRDGIQAGGC